MRLDPVVSDIGDYSYSESDQDEHHSQRHSGASCAPSGPQPVRLVAAAAVSPFDAPEQSAFPDNLPAEPDAIDPKTFGQCLIMHVELAEPATAADVAATLRNLAPGVIIACCGSASMAIQLADYLARPPIGDPEFRKTLGEGAPRPGKTELQLQFIVNRSESIVFAGRRGLCKCIDPIQQVATPLDGTMVVVDVGFGVCIENTLTQRVAAIVVRSATYAGSDLGLRSWELAANTLAQKSVRVLAFKDAPHELHVEMARHLQFTSICRQQNISPSFFVIGPVTNIAGNRDTITKYYPTGVDETYAWPPIGEIKLKKSTVVEEAVVTTTVVVGGNASRRTPEAWERRTANASERAAKNKFSPNFHGNLWGDKGKGKCKGKGKGKGKG